MGNGSNNRERRYEDEVSRRASSHGREMDYEEERSRRNQPWSPTERYEYRERRDFSDEGRGYGYGGSGSQGYGGNRGGYGGGDYGYGREGSEFGDYGQSGSRYGYGGRGKGSVDPFPEPGRGLGYGRGGHRGKGPKGYTRSDDRIREDVNEKLWDDDYLDASNIEVEVSNGEVTLSGEVAERSAKRRAEDLAEDCSGVKNVQNNIRVGGETRDSQQSRGASAR